MNDTAVNDNEILAAQLPHLVLLPGLVHDARLWQHQTSGLSHIATTWVGDLTKPSSITATSTSIHELARSILLKAPAKQFALAGLSMGGYVALEIMRQAPERILGLALLDTSARADSAEALENRRQSIERAKTDYPAVIDELLPKLIHPAQMDNQVLTNCVIEMATSLGSDTFIRQQKAIAERSDSLPFLSAIQCPTLIICGREDKVTPLEVSEEMASEIKGSRLLVIDDCGHLSALEQPLRVNEAMAQWLLQISTSDASLVQPGFI